MALARFVLSIILASMYIAVNSLGYEEDNPRSKHNDFLPYSPHLGQCNVTVSIYEDVVTPQVTQHNYNKPLTCWYKFRRSGTPSSDYVIDIRFKKFNVGSIYNSSSCEGGYIQIIDGSSTTDVTNQLTPGFFCGEIQGSRNFISETNTVELIFHADRYSENTYMTFFSRTELTRGLHQRYGKQPELYPDGRRGRPGMVQLLLLRGSPVLTPEFLKSRLEATGLQDRAIPPKTSLNNYRETVGSNNYCERVFSNCRPDSCMVQSPGYPGPYPRNLHCRYHLSVQTAFIKLFTAEQQISVDGQLCDSPMTCPLRHFTSDARRCTRDWITVYDGKSELEPKIGTFCGFGRFPYSIIGSGTDLLVTFKSSAAGPLLNKGFQFSVGSVPGQVDMLGRKEGDCDWLFASRRMRRAGHLGGQFTSLAHWYPANTTCKYLLRAEPAQMIRLRFDSFRVSGAPTAADNCQESLSVYDGAAENPLQLVRFFCDSLSAPSENEDVLSSGRALLVVFSSSTGSFESSSLFYRARFDFFQRSWWGEPVAASRCDEVITPRAAAGGRFGSPQNRLVFETTDDVHCRYVFEADSRRFQQLLINITSGDFRLNCPSGTTDTGCFQTSSNLISSSDSNAFCVCRSSQLPHVLLTDFPNITLHLSLSSAAGQEVVKDGLPVFQGEYHFVNDPYCGRPSPLEDMIRYPALEHTPEGGTYCVWKITIEDATDVWFRVDELSLSGDCSRNRLRVFTSDFRLLRDLCAGSEGSSHVIPGDQLLHVDHVQFHLQASESGARLAVRWSRLSASAPAGRPAAWTSSMSSTSSSTAAGWSLGGQQQQHWMLVGLVAAAVGTAAGLATLTICWLRRRSDVCLDEVM